MFHEKDSCFVTKLAKPNVLVILADDLGYADVGFHGGRDIPPPNLDRWQSRACVAPTATSRIRFAAPPRWVADRPIPAAFRPRKQPRVVAGQHDGRIAVIADDLTAGIEDRGLCDRLVDLDVFGGPTAVFSDNLLARGEVAKVDVAVSIRGLFSVTGNRFTGFDETTSVALMLQPDPFEKVPRFICRNNVFEQCTTPVGEGAAGLVGSQRWPRLDGGKAAGRPSQADRLQPGLQRRANNVESQGRNSLPVDRGSDLAPQASRLLVQQFQNLLPIKLVAGQVRGNGDQ